MSLAVFEAVTFPVHLQDVDVVREPVTDPESRIMKGADGMVQGYNAQAAAEPELLLIVGQSVTEAANDKQQLAPMVELIEQQSGQRPEAVVGRQRILFGAETWSTWNRPSNRSVGSRGSSRPASKSMASIDCRPSVDPCRKARRRWTG